MRLILLAIYFFFGLPDAQAIIFGTDDRLEISAASPILRKLGNSVPALIHKNKLVKQKTSFLFQGPTLESLGTCAEEKFSAQRQVANCSGSLITPFHVLTAAHCLDKHYFTCENYRIVFGYQNAAESIPESDVYLCKKIIYHEFDPFLKGLDLAIIELDRSVRDREPVSLNFTPRIGEALSMIGYPFGVPQKSVEVGTLTGIRPGTVHSFAHDLDTISSNSGGPIFNSSGEQVGVLTRSTGSNLLLDENSQCQRWALAGSEDFAEANDLSSLKKTLAKIRASR